MINHNLFLLYHKSEISSIPASQVDKPGLKLARINVSGQKGNLSIINFHFLIGNEGDADVEYFTELHELGLFTKKEYLEAFQEAGLETTHDPQGITGRGLYISVKP